MPRTLKPVAASDAPASNATNYPAPYNELMVARRKAKLGDIFGLKNFGVNQTSVEPRGVSALKHQHARQDEFVYVLSGTLTLHYGDADHVMDAGDCIGFPAGGAAHQFENTSAETAVLLEIGDRSDRDRVEYADVDMIAEMLGPGEWRFLHKDGRPYA